MTDNARVFLASLAGAAAGGILGYLYLTEHGRQVRDQLEPKLDGFQNELRKLSRTISKAQSVATEGWRSLTELASEMGRSSSSPSSSSGWNPPRQASPY